MTQVMLAVVHPAVHLSCAGLHGPPLEASGDQRCIWTGRPKGAGMGGTLPLGLYPSGLQH